MAPGPVAPCARHPGRGRPLFLAILLDEALNRQSLTIRIELLIPAGASLSPGPLLLGLVLGPATLEQGIPVTLYTGLRSYFVSQLGKYVPGKAWVILMRVGMLARRAPSWPWG